MRVRPVSIQGEHLCGAFLDDARAGVSMSVNASFVALGIIEPPFQIQIVLRDLKVITTGKQMTLKLFIIFAVCCETVSCFPAKLSFSVLKASSRSLLLPVSVSRVFSTFFTHLTCWLICLKISTVALKPLSMQFANRQTSLWLSVSRPRSMLTCRDARTFFRESIMRRPEGYVGLPWLLFSMPRIALQ